jgi:hypothetical protein
MTRLSYFEFKEIRDNQRREQQRKVNEWTERVDKDYYNYECIVRNNPEKRITLMAYLLRSNTFTIIPTDVAAAASIGSKMKPTGENISDCTGLCIGEKSFMR